MPNANFETRGEGGNLFCFVVPLYAKTLDDLTRPTQLEIVENECLFIGELSEHRKLGRNCYCCLDSRFAKDGRGGGFVGNKAGGKHPRLQ